MAELGLLSTTKYVRCPNLVFLKLLVGEVGFGLINAPFPGMVEGYGLGVLKHNQGRQ